MIERKTRAIEVFREFERLESRIPSKEEFDLAYYGRKLRRGESNWYYAVKKKFLAEEAF